MKKIILYSSLTANVVVAVYFITKRIYYSYFTEPPRYSYKDIREGIFKLSTIDSNDVVFVGNSLTEWFIVSELFGPNCKNRGILGNELKDIFMRIGAIANAHPRKMFIEAGTNDIIHNAEPHSVFNEYMKLIEQVRAQSPGTVIYVQSVLPAGREFDKKSNIIELNTYLRDYCCQNALEYIDLYSSFQRDGYITDSLSYDGVHLNGNGYKLWASIIEKHVSCNK